MDFQLDLIARANPAAFAGPRVLSETRAQWQDRAAAKAQERYDRAVRTGLERQRQLRDLGLTA